MKYGINLVFEEYFARDNKCFPLEYKDGNLIILYSDDCYLKNIIEYSKKENLGNLLFQKLSINQIERYINTYYSIELREKRIYSEIRNFIDKEEYDLLFTYIIKSASNYDASDIHIYNEGNYCIIRFRIKGRVVTFSIIDKEYLDILSRIVKVKGNIDISKTTSAIDTRINIFELDSLDIRVSIINTVQGDKISLRILQEQNIPKYIDEVVNNKNDLKMLIDVLEKESGAILVTGPTGSGKSTLIRCFLTYINDGKKHIISLEDPIEYTMDVVTQIQVDSKDPNSFNNGVKSILRQDPDIIFIGEIRDEISAEVAMKASITGHLVFTTLHTQTNLLAIDRLKNLNIDEDIIFNCIKMIINQRLISTQCPFCKRETIYSGYDIREISLKNGDSIYISDGCEKCSYTGIHSREIVMDICEFNNDFKEKYVVGNYFSDKIKNDVINKYQNGEISLNEVRKFL